jgi:hypothetical protein
MLYTAFGCNIFASSDFIILRTSSHLTIFIPPPAELAQLPASIAMNNSALDV